MSEELFIQILFHLVRLLAESLSEKSLVIAPVHTSLVLGDFPNEKQRDHSLPYAFA